MATAMKVRWKSSGNLPIEVHAYQSNSRARREYSISKPSFTPVHLCALWLSGGKRTTYGLSEYNPDGNTPIGHQGWRTMQEVVDFAADYFYAER